MLLRFIISLQHLLLANANYFSYKSRECSHQKQMVEYTGLKLTTNAYLYRTDRNVRNRSHCTAKCQVSTDCECINVLKRGDGYIICKYYRATADGELISDPDASLLCKSDLQCSGYCDQFDYVGICGDCRCKDLCNSPIPNICDCTDVHEPIENCSVLEENNDMPVAGLYRISNDNDTQNGFCQEGLEGKLWFKVLQIFKRINQQKEIEISDEIGHPFLSDYWSGWDSVYRFTQTHGGAILRAEGMTDEGNIFYIDYLNFTLSRTYIKEFYTTEYTRVESNTCMRDFFQNEFVGRQCLFEDLAGSCRPDPIQLSRNKWTFNSLTLLLRPVGSNKSISIETKNFTLTHKKQKVGFHPRIASEICFRMELMVFTQQLYMRSFFQISSHHFPNLVEFRFVNNQALCVKVKGREICNVVSIVKDKWYPIEVTRFKIAQAWHIEFMVDDILMGTMMIEAPPEEELNLYVNLVDDGRPIDGIVRNIYLNSHKIM